MNKEELLLRDPKIFPSDEVLEDVLGQDVFAVYSKFADAVFCDEGDLILGWRYYKDGKAWLGKAVCKKKTVFWLSVWKDYFQIGIHFTERTRNVVGDLDIASDIKSKFASTPVAGKLVPLILAVDSDDQLADLIKIVECKKNLK